MWWNGLALSWGFKKCIIYGYGTWIGYIRDWKKFTVGGGGGGGLFDFSVSLNQIYLDLDLIWFDLELDNNPYVSSKLVL